MIDQELSDKLWAGVIKTAHCWEWGLGKSKAGYGAIRWKGKQYKTHRVAWESINGPIPEGMLICHKCDNPPCCNPEHLFLGTTKDNAMDREAKGRRKRLYYPRRSPDSMPRGENHKNSKLTDYMVIEILLLHRGGISKYALAKQYKVTRQTIRRIVERRGWRHINI